MEPHSTSLNTEQLVDRVFELPEIVAVLSDRQLVELGRAELTDPIFQAHFWAEILTRIWLYENRGPEELVKLEESFWVNHQEWKQHFQTQLFPLRHEDDGRELPDSECFDPEIWGFLITRIRAFLEADGLIALIPPSAEITDGVAVPFRFIADDASHFWNAKGRPLVAKEWSDVLEDLGNFGPLACRQSVRIGAMFPQNMSLSGASLGLPLAVAWARRQARDFPLFSPLALLATGEIKGGKVFAVRGTRGQHKTDNLGGCKGQLAQRLGVKLYLAVDVPPQFAAGKPFRTCSFTSSKSWEHVHSQVAHAVRQLKLPDAPRLLDRVDQEESQPRSGEILPQPELWSRWRRLGRVRNAFPENDRRCTRAKTGQQRLENDLGFSGVSIIAAESDNVVSDYHKRVFVGRKDEGLQLDEFLKNPQGGTMVVLGPPGYGKSALLAQLLKRVPSDRALLVHFFRQNRERTRVVAGFVKRLWHFLLSELGDGQGITENISHDELVSRVDIAWQDWADQPVSLRRPLVIVIDGLDEAKDAFDPPWPRGLPDHVHVIVSCRTGPNYVPPPGFKSWLPEPPHSPPSGLNTETSVSGQLCLCGLKTDDIVDLLSARFASLSEPQRASVPDLKKIAGEIARRTGGSALFAHYLVDDLFRGIESKQSLESIFARTPPDFANYLYQQYLDFDGPGAVQARQLITLLVAAYGPLHLGEVQRILPGIEPGYAFTDLPWQSYRWFTRQPGTEDWGEQFSLADDSLREALAKVVVQNNAKERLLAFCKAEKHRSPYAARHAQDHILGRLMTPALEISLDSPTVGRVQSSSPAPPTALTEAPTNEPKTGPEEVCHISRKSKDSSDTDNIAIKQTVSDPIPQFEAQERPVATWSELEALSEDPVFVAISSRELPDEPAPVLSEVRRALENAIQREYVDYALLTQLALTHAKLVHQLAQQGERPGQQAWSAPEAAKHFLRLPVQWDPAAQVMWRLLAAWEDHKANRITERDRHLRVLCGTFDVRLPAAWSFLAGALFVEILPPYHPMLRTLATRFLSIDALAEMVGRIVWSGEDGIIVAREWLKRASSYEKTVLRRHVVYSLAKCGRFRDAEWEARAASTVKEQANLILQMAELIENALDRTDDLKKWIDYLEMYVEYAALSHSDLLRVKSVLGRIAAIRVRHHLLRGHNNSETLVEQAESFVQGGAFTRGSGKFDVQVALACAHASAAVSRKGHAAQSLLRAIARQHRRNAFRAWLRLRATSGDTLEVFQIWLWFAHLTFQLVRQGALSERIGRNWENRVRRILISTSEAGDLRIRALLNVSALNASSEDQGSLRHLEPVEQDSAIIAAVEAVLEAVSFSNEEILQVISRSRSVEARAKGMARWIKKLVETGQSDVLNSCVGEAQLRPEDEAAAHSLLARRLLSNEDYESAGRHIVSCIQSGMEQVEGWESLQRVELLAALSRAAGSEGGAFFKEAEGLVNAFSNSKPVEKTLLCSSLAQTAIFHRRRGSPFPTNGMSPGRFAQTDKFAWTDEANHWFGEISKLQECPGTGYQRRARKVMILCENAKHLFELDWNSDDQKDAIKRADILAQNEPSLQRRCELMCEVAHAYVECGDADGANDLFANIQSELPVSSTANLDGYLWRKPGIKPKMIRTHSLAHLVLGLGRGSILAKKATHKVKPLIQIDEFCRNLNIGRPLTKKQRERIEAAFVAIQEGKSTQALHAASQISGEHVTAAELRAAVFRVLASRLDWSEWSLAYINDPDLRSNQLALRGWALASASRNQWDEAWKFVRRITDPMICADTFRDLAEFSARVGRLYDVRRRAQNLMSSQDKDRVLHRILASLVERYREGSDIEERKEIRRVLMELVPSCAESFGTTYLMIARLIEISPSAWRKIAEVLRSRGVINTL